MKRIIGYVNTADLNHMREEDVRALTVINIAFGLIGTEKLYGMQRMHGMEWYPFGKAIRS